VSFIFIFVYFHFNLRTSDYKLTNCVLFISHRKRFVSSRRKTPSA
jgi:hypothetical protein